MITCRPLPILFVALLAAQSAFGQDADHMCSEFSERGTTTLHGDGITVQVSNHGTVSAPGNNATDIRWKGLGYGYEFGLFVAAEIPGRGTRGLGVPRRDANGRIEYGVDGDTAWVRHVVSDGLLSRGGERSPDRTEWWGWHPTSCVGEPAPELTSCFTDAVVDETSVMNDLRNREFDYYPLQGDSTWHGLGLVVEARIVQSSNPALRDVLFLMHRIENRGRVDLHRVNIGMWGDPHVGGAFNYQDDRALFVPDLGLVEVWDADGIGDTPGLIPGYFGYQFLEGPSGLTSLTATPFNDLDIADDDQIWDLVKPGRFDPIPSRPGDDVYLMGSGSRRLRVGESVRFAVALILSGSSGDLRAKAKTAREVFSQECGAAPDPVIIDRVSAPTPHIGGAALRTRETPCPLSSCDPLPFSDDELSCTWMGGPTLNLFVTTPSRIRESLMDAPGSVSVIEGEQFIRDPGSSIASTLRHTVGVDIAQAGTDRQHVTTRGFNQSFAGNNQLLVDYRQAAVPGLAFNSYALLPAAPIDIAQAEVVRGSASGLYGSRADHGVIQFLTKEPFEYPGTAVSASYGENERVEGAVRHAGILSSRFAYKVVGSYSQANDLLFDDAGPEDLALRMDPVEEDATRGFARGTLQYRHVPCGCLTVTANVDHAGMQQNLLHDTGEMFADYRLSTGQLKVESEALFAQFYYMQGDAGDSFDYRTGLPIVDESNLFAGQFRYKTDLFEGREKLIVGLDYDRTNSDTGGDLILNTSLSKRTTVPSMLSYPAHLGRHGRNEADDALTNLGIYLQSRTTLSPDFDLNLSGRMDFDNVIDPQFSPSFNLLYQPGSSHAFRLSLNRGFGRPTNLQFYADFPVDNSGLFPIRARGALNGWTFSAPPKPTSLFPGEGFGTLDDGIGMDLDRAFGIATDSLFGPSGLLEGWDALEDFLSARGEDISGFSEGVLRYESTLEAPIVAVPKSIPEIKPTVTRSIEIGYKGNFENKTFVGIDFFYAKTKNHLSELRAVTPLVFVPNLPEDLTEEIFRVFTDEELARYKLSRQDLAWLYTSIVESLGQRPVGILEPEENFSTIRGPEQLLSWVNFGEVDYVGVDLEFRRVVNEWFSYFGNMSWLSENFFDDEALGEAGSGNELALNAPRFKFAAGFDRTFLQRYQVSVAGRYIDQFDVRSGVHRGHVDDYLLLDLGLGVTLDEVSPGLRLDVMGENLLDQEHREWVDVPAVGRTVTARLTYVVD